MATINKINGFNALMYLLLCIILLSSTFKSFSQNIKIPTVELNRFNNITFQDRGMTNTKSEVDSHDAVFNYSTHDYTLAAEYPGNDKVAFYTRDKTDSDAAGQSVQNQSSLYSRGFYIKADVGIGMGLATEMLTQFTTTSSESGSTTITKNIKAHLGTGLPLELAAGYKFDHHYAIELAVDYYSGFSTKKVDMSNSDVLTTKVSSSMFSVTPSFKMQIECGPVLPFARIGPEIGFQNYFKTVMTGPTYLFKSTQATQMGEMDTRDYGGIALGIKAAVGVEYPITKMISVFGEVQGRAISFSPKHGKITKYTVDGADQLSSLSTKAKSWDFVKSKDSSVPLPNDQPNQFLQVSHSLSYVALAVGVIFNFGKPKNN